jgi:glycosyltransferase involved in cell wall biosynthesis
MKSDLRHIKSKEEKAVYKDTKELLHVITASDYIVYIAKHTYCSLNKVKDLSIKPYSIIDNGIKDEYLPLDELSKRALGKKYGVSINMNTPVLLFAGRLDEVKGVPYLIEAFNKVVTKYPEAKLFIAGEGSFLQLMDISNPHWANIAFTGKLKREQLFELYQIATMGIVPSLHEEFGLVAAEMMMFKLPIIATNTSGLSELIEDKVSGLLVPIVSKEGLRQVDVACLAEKMEYLIENPEASHILGENARKRFLDKYELSLFQKRMIHLYDTI